MTILANGLDTRYITSSDLEQYFVDKSTGQPLAGGQVFFYEDINRTTPKPVYQLTYNSMTKIYSYTALPNPLTISATGNFDDGNNNNIAVYYFPYDEFGNLQLYYVVVTDANMLLQFTRDAWPFPASGATGGGGGGTSSTTLSLNNMLTNPQFTTVNFIAGSTITIPYTSAGVSVLIAPGWTLNVQASGTGSLTVAQTPVAGSTAYPYNPPFVLTITPGQFITSLIVQQQFNNNPDWAASNFLSGSILLAPNSALVMQYVQSNALTTPVIILTASNTSVNWTQYNATVSLPAATNPQNGLTGYDLIQLSLPLVAQTTFSNVQVVPLLSNVAITTFDQTPVNRQVDQMFNYYLPLLSYKPIPSFLIGWDFSLNPAQPLGANCGPFATGANSSNYIWDQTILFQGENNNLTVVRNISNRSLNVIAGASNDSFAVIQYLDLNTAREILQNPLSVNVSGLSGGFNCCISLWYTTDTTLPSTIGSNKSLVATLSSTGKPLSFNGNWIEIPRSGAGNGTSPSLLGDATFVMTPTSTGDVVDHGFAGWDLAGNTGTLAATYFAIVVGCGELLANQSIDFFSISLVPGSIPTRPAPQSAGAVLAECQEFYEMSFPVNTVPAQNIGLNTGEWYTQQVKAASTANQLLGTIPFKVSKYAVPGGSTGSTTLYTPSTTGASGQAWNVSTSTNCSATTGASFNQDGITLSCTTSSSSQLGNALAIHFTSDCRLGQ